MSLHQQEDRPERKAAGAGNQPRPADAPATTIRSFEPKWRSNAQENATECAADEPAPTVTAGHDSGEREWIADDPDNLKGEDWPDRRPSTVVAGDARIFQPGNHRESVPGEQSQNAVRVTTQEASILQGFPPDYPWQGSRTKQFQQIGNAVPPPLAQAVLTALVGEAKVEKAA